MAEWEVDAPVGYEVRAWARTELDRVLGESEKNSLGVASAT
jgi:hypothetical protein